MRIFLFEDIFWDIHLAQAMIFSIQKDYFLEHITYIYAQRVFLGFPSPSIRVDVWKKLSFRVRISWKEKNIPYTVF